MRKIIVDCDPGMDDSSAIIMAVKNPSLDIQAVTTVNGNYPVDITYRNARRIMRMLGREDIPVYRGCSRPLVRDIPNDPFTHGRDGQGESFRRIRSCRRTRPTPSMRLSTSSVSIRAKSHWSVWHR